MVSPGLNWIDKIKINIGHAKLVKMIENQYDKTVELTFEGGHDQVIAKAIADNKPAEIGTIGEISKMVKYSDGFVSYISFSRK